MAYGGSNDDVIDDVMWPSKVKVVIPISLSPLFRKRLEIETRFQRGTIFLPNPIQEAQLKQGLADRTAP